MSESWLAFSIGPVKPVIDNSRKTRDLYAGSYLLSLLMNSALAYLKNADGVRIILPVKGKNNIPNRLVAAVSGFDRAARRELAEALDGTVRQTFRGLCEQLFKKLEISPNEAVWAQLERFPEVYWAYAECEDPTSGVSEAVERLQGVKQLRTFSQTREPYGRKCTLFPEYNAVFARKNERGEFPQYTDAGHVTDLTDIIACRYAVNTSEGLSAIAFVKRMLFILAEGEDVLPGYNRDLPSVAYMLLNSRLGSYPELTETLRELREEASEAVFDLQNGQILTDEEYSSEHIALAEKLFSKLSGQEIKVSPYYALVKFDGDSIGALYHKCSENEQTVLSKRLSEFADYVRETIQRYSGICIYAGGEDFLGFLPLETLFPAMLELRRAFPERITAPQGYGKPLTFSAGIVVAHLMQPLQDVLETADEMESMAKFSEGKDSFAIAVNKRGGATLRLKCKFGKNCENMEILLKTICDFQQMSQSVSFAYRLTEMLERVRAAANPEKDGMVLAIMRQALSSQQSGDGSGSEKSSEHLKNLNELYCCLGNNVGQLIAALQTAVFFKKEMAPCTIV